MSERMLQARWKLRRLIETIAQIATRLMGRDIEEESDGDTDPNNIEPVI